MGYFDYIDSKSKKEEMTVSLDERWARMAFYISLGALGLFVLSIILTAVIHMGVSLWLNVVNFVGIGVAITGLIINQKTVSHFRKKRQPSAIANMARALNIFWILMHILMIALNLMFLYY